MAAPASEPNLIEIGRVGWAARPAPYAAQRCDRQRRPRIAAGLAEA